MPIKDNDVLISSEELENDIIGKFSSDKQFGPNATMAEMQYWNGQKSVLDFLRRVINEKRNNPLAE